MNGTIDVESEKGVGSVFTVVVTLKNCEPHGASLESTIDRTQMRVLVVDDEKLAIDHARTILDEAGIRVDTCMSGQEALTMLDVQHTKQEPYNLVLMDRDMPGMDGIEAARRIRERYGSESAVVILTAYNWDDIVEEATQAGVDGFLAKPLFASSVVGEFERIARRNNLSLFKEKQRAELTGRRILLAEDMEINAEIMMDVLDMEDIQSEHAENGRVAVEMFKKSAPGYYDAILMDVRMPEMDGLEAASAIRAIDRADAKRIPMGVQAMKHAALLQAWSGRIAECRSSGKTVKAWCEAEGVSIKTYNYWEKRIVAEASQQASLPATTRGSLLVRVNPETLSGGDAGSSEGCFTIRHAKSTSSFINQFIFIRGIVFGFFYTLTFLFGPPLRKKMNENDTPVCDDS